MQCCIQAEQERLRGGQCTLELNDTQSIVVTTTYAALNPPPIGIMLFMLTNRNFYRHLKKTGIRSEERQQLRDHALALALVGPRPVEIIEVPFFRPDPKTAN